MSKQKGRLSGQSRNGHSPQDGALEPYLESRQLDVSNVAKRLGVHPSTIYRLCEEKELMCFKVRGRIKIPELALKDYRKRSFATSW